jgi:hypothetical protein
MVDNPAYKMWMNSNVGSSVSMDMQVNAAGGPAMKMQTTRKLTEKTDDHVTLEITSTVTVMGQTHTTPPKDFPIKSKCEKQDVHQTSTEDVTAAGQTFHCTVYEVTAKTAGVAPPPGQKPQQQNIRMKIWTSPDVPGGMVKMEMPSSHGTITMILTSFHKA